MLRKEFHAVRWEWKWLAWHFWCRFWKWKRCGICWYRGT